MIRKIFSELEKGARDALRAYLELIAMPFTIARSFAHTVNKALHWF